MTKSRSDWKPVPCVVCHKVMEVEECGFSRSHYHHNACCPWQPPGVTPENEGLYIIAGLMGLTGAHPDG